MIKNYQSPCFRSFLHESQVDKENLIFYLSIQILKSNIYKPTIEKKTLPQRIYLIDYLIHSNCQARNIYPLVSRAQYFRFINQKSNVCQGVKTHYAVHTSTLYTQAPYIYIFFFSYSKLFFHIATTKVHSTLSFF